MRDQPLRILIIEDNPAEAELARELLAGSPTVDFEAESVLTLAEGVERLTEDRFDAVLLDFHLPDGEGAITVEKVRDVAPETPVVILTNLDDEEAAFEAMRLGAQDYLVKRDVDRRLLTRSLWYAVTRSEVERARRRSEERWALAAEGAHDGLWEWDIPEDTLELSPRWHGLLGFEEGELGETLETWLARVHPRDRPSLEAALEAHLEGEDDHFEHEHRIRDSEGRYRWVIQRGLAVRDAEGAPYRMAGSMNDITARKRAEAQLAHDAIHDPLTGLPNRALLRDRLDQTLRHVHRQDEDHCALLFLDIDRFKNVNESLGHDAGDELLQLIAERLVAVVREADTVARLGGDEFAVLVHDVEEVSDAGHAAGRILEQLTEAFRVAGSEVYAGTSIGISLSASGYERSDDMIRDAEIAMYRAKAAGKNRYEVFDEEMHRRAVTLLKMETDLRRALERDEFVMHYQPVVSLTSDELVGFEALVRWQHPE
ncbi:MAG: diguanylate cyclase, partial [Thermoanaerobaculia bacterium]|nr:diguanylate cyclase [Thermoanaerobaculia bacterium]